jgi:AhpD family alkylhydroperoxidase
LTHENILDDLRQPARALRDQIPAVLESYAALSGAVFVDGALDAKTKELIALAISVTKQCDGCIASHARAAARRGASVEEVAEALGVTIVMNGGPGTVYAPRAFEAFQEFAST